KEMVDGAIMPTPGAVMEATKLLYEIIGDVIVVDVGGATTDVHSVTEGSVEILDILVTPEPKAKRTVEGDLGV
ncbi:DNA mismatch repair protein MutL, partial [Acinetobacter baumannii]|nr:DNA mismatch repair protein MutL [Acinetobacter baumannii]